jgi:hypothetical protein
MRGGELEAGMDWSSVDGNNRESGLQADWKLNWMSGGRCEGEKIECIDCLGPVIRGTTLQIEFDCLLGAHSDQDLAVSESLPVGDIALIVGSHWCTRDRAAGRRGNKG